MLPFSSELSYISQPIVVECSLGKLTSVTDTENMVDFVAMLSRTSIMICELALLLWA